MFKSFDKLKKFLLVLEIIFVFLLCIFFLFKDVSKECFLFLIFCCVIGLLGTMFVYFRAKIYFSLSCFEQKKYLIFKFNKDILVDGDVSNINIKKYTEVVSFGELMKVQKCVNLPIIYSCNNNSFYIFILKLGDSGYYYKLEDNNENKNEEQNSKI